MKKMKWFLILFLFYHLTVDVSCKKNPFSSDNSQSTLSKVDNFPLYIMNYQGDYNFHDKVSGEIQSSSVPEKTEHTAGLTWGCTCFTSLSHEGPILLGRNFDWYNHPALLLFTNPPNRYASVSMVDIYYLGFSKSNPPTRNSRALSDAPFIPFDGMNEKGLAVGMMAVSHAEKTEDPNRVTLSSLEVIRLFLDYAETVEECTALIRQFNIDFSDGPPIHYMVCDSTRRSAVIEFINGAMHVNWNTHPWQVSTNFNLTGYTLIKAKNMCWRYKTIYDSLEKTNGIISELDGMALLENVAQSNTIWSLMYNCSTKEINVVMGKKYSQILEYGFNN